MTFVRLYGCNLSCAYCDTPEARSENGELFHKGARFKNPVTVDFVADRVEDRIVSITGGEPLLQSDFLNELCLHLSEMNRSLYLETNGSLSENLKGLIGYFDTLALDFKIPSATGQAPLWVEHERSLILAAQKSVFVKIAVTNDIQQHEIMKVCEIVARVRKSIPLVIQPVFGEHIDNLLDIQKAALQVLDDVRVIPQIHKYIGIK